MLFMLAAVDAFSPQERTSCRCWFRVVPIDRLHRGNFDWCCSGNASSLTGQWVMQKIGLSAIGNDSER